MIARFLFAFLTVILPATAAEPSAMTQPRSLDQFTPLLRRSPFTVPTAEESSPLAERFSLTGAMVMDGKDQVFVLDRTTLIRQRVTSEPGESGLQLVEFLPDADPRKMRATIRLGDQTATITFHEPPAPAADKVATTGPAPASVTPPAVAKPPSIKRRIITRPKISGNPAPVR